MSGLKSVLDDAAEAGIITVKQAPPLAAFLEERGVIAPALPSPARKDVDLGLDAEREPEDPAFETEAPRFIRGFHDVLITIGVVIALVGASGLGSVFTLLPLTIVLAEVLVRRQRLALPAVALTIAYILSIAAIISATLDLYRPEVVTNAFTVIGQLAPFPLMLAAFHWRYRVPLSLALCIVSIVALVVALVMTSLDHVYDLEDILDSYKIAVVLVLLAAAIALFAIAMRFDMRDPMRRTRRSDVAFWLHLVTAPFLLSTTLSLVFLNEFDGFSLYADRAGLPQALLTIVVVVSFMLVGIIIDRRAFVTSGLLSLGYAVYAIFQNTGLEVGTFIYATLLIVGALVLTLGIGWTVLRRIVFAVLPESLKTKLPPLR